MFIEHSTFRSEYTCLRAKHSGFGLEHICLSTEHLCMTELVFFFAGVQVFGFFYAYRCKHSVHNAKHSVYNVKHNMFNVKHSCFFLFSQFSGCCHFFLGVFMCFY